MVVVNYWIVNIILVLWHFRYTHMAYQIRQLLYLLSSFHRNSVGRYQCQFSSTSVLLSIYKLVATIISAILSLRKTMLLYPVPWWTDVFVAFIIQKLAKQRKSQLILINIIEKCSIYPCRLYVLSPQLDETDQWILFFEICNSI